MAEKIVVTALVNRDCFTVWQLYNQPEHIIHWNFARDDWCCPRAENDLRVGGRLLARMQVKDGSFGFDFEATYDEVIAGSFIAYTLGDGRQVQTTFQDAGSATRVSTSFDAEAANSAEVQRAGWQAILDNFKRYAESAET